MHAVVGLYTLIARHCSSCPPMFVIGLSADRKLETSALLAQRVFSSGEPVFCLQQKALSLASRISRHRRYAPEVPISFLRL